MYRILITILSLLFIYNTSYADSDAKNKALMHKKSKVLMQKMTFYAQPFQKPNLVPLEKFCGLGKNKAQNYLARKQKQAKTNFIASYHYGMLIGFAPCVSKRPMVALNHLKRASHNGITKANFLAGLLLLKNNDFKNAQTYFHQGAQSLHAKSAYNYSVLKSKKFTKIDDDIIQSLKISASEGNDIARHDAALSVLKLKLDKKQLLTRNELLQTSDTLNKILNNTKNTLLRDMVQENLIILNMLTNEFSAYYQPRTYPTELAASYLNQDSTHAYEKISIYLQNNSLNYFNKYMNIQ